MNTFNPPTFELPIVQESILTDPLPRETLLIIIHQILALLKEIANVYKAVFLYTVLDIQPLSVLVESPEAEYVFQLNNLNDIITLHDYILFSVIGKE